MKIATRSISRSAKGRARLVLEMRVSELHEIEAHARHAGLPLGTYCGAVLLAGDRTCEHGISVLATGAGACLRCWAERRAIAGKVIELQPTAASPTLNDVVDDLERRGLVRRVPRTGGE